MGCTKSQQQRAGRAGSSRDGDGAMFVISPDECIITRDPRRSNETKGLAKHFEVSEASE